MANGTDSEEFVVCSKIRTGLKREFAFALKYQSQISGSGGRTRGRKAQGGFFGNVGSENLSNKRLKSSDSKAIRDLADEGSNESGKGEERLASDVPVKTVRKGVGEGEEEVVESDGVVFVSKDEPKSHVVEVESREELKEDTVKAGEEPKSNAIEVMDCISDDQPKSSAAESLSMEDLKNDTLEGIQEDELKVDKVTPEKFQCNVEQRKEGVESPLKGGYSEESPIVAEKSFRRFTRSTLQSAEISSNGKPTQVSVATENSVDDISTEGDAVEEVGVASSSLTSPPTKILKLGLSNNFPRKLKDFLETGLLEGLNVKYVRGPKSKGYDATGLQGVIRGSGIVCSCDVCKGEEVISPNLFEVHAGSSNKRPPEYIYLENGKTLRDVMNACRSAPSDTLEETLRDVTGCSSVKMSDVCLYCRGSIPKAGSAKSALICNLCLKLKEPQAEPQATPTQTTLRNNTGNGSPEPVSIMKSSKNVSKHGTSRSKRQGRITRKDLGFHKLVFEGDSLTDGTELEYHARGQKVLVGYKKGVGIFCSCCKSEVSPSQFEAHAGFASRRKPFHNIFTYIGDRVISLHLLAYLLAKGRKLSSKDNDDLCTTCSEGGELLCCDRCPRAFHKECVSLPTVPTGEWYCRFCHKIEKENIERNANAIAAGRLGGVDVLEELSKRCIRIVENPDDVGGCALCRSQKFSKSKKFGPLTVIICDQCEKEYHVGCLRKNKMENLKELPEGKWFCCEDCKRIHSTLDKLVDQSEQELPDSLYDIIIKKLEGLKPTNIRTNLDIKWRMISGKTASKDSKLLLGQAVTIFRERFATIPDAETSRDLIPMMVHGQTTKSRDFGGMYTAILTVNSVVVSAGIVRIFGSELAELPLVATSDSEQGKGYFQALYSCLEKLLASLNVNHLVIPAAEGAEAIWMNKFGLKEMTTDELHNFSRHHYLMSFEDITWLQKPIPR